MLCIVLESQKKKKKKKSEGSEEFKIVQGRTKCNKFMIQAWSRLRFLPLLHCAVLYSVFKGLEGEGSNFSVLLFCFSSALSCCPLDSDLQKAKYWVMVILVAPAFSTLSDRVSNLNCDG